MTVFSKNLVKIKIDHLLLTYTIQEDTCTGCTVCAKKCPVGAIKGARKKSHGVDQILCIKCGNCADMCRFGAVQVFCRAKLPSGLKA